MPFKAVPFIPADGDNQAVVGSVSVTEDPVDNAKNIYATEAEANTAAGIKTSTAADSTAAVGSGGRRRRRNRSSKKDKKAMMTAGRRRRSGKKGKGTKKGRK